MRIPGHMLLFAGVLALAACEKPQDKPPDATEALSEIDLIDNAHLTEVMMRAADPGEAVNYFARASARHPERIDLKRGLALSLLRAGRGEEAVPIWAEIVASGAATNEDRVHYADALIRSGEWAKADAVLDEIPPDYRTYDRYRLEAMVADYNRDWEKADAFYAEAVRLAARPAAVYNNWGFSMLSRGKPEKAEEYLYKAITLDPRLFAAKNNLAIAFAAQGKYRLPNVPMTQDEKARLLYTLALGALKRGDAEIARKLLREAIDTSPRYFPEAVRTLETLEREAIG